jgi:hypothetical protein
MLLGLLPSAASADSPPDVSGSTLGCVDTGGGALLPGDDLTCTLTVVTAQDSESAELSATIGLPSTVDFVSSPLPSTYDASSRLIDLNENTIGLMFADQIETIVFHISVASDLAAGTPITLSGQITAVGHFTQTVVNQPIASPDVPVSPSPADLEDSTLTCSDVNGGVLLAGEQVTCELDVINTAGHEDATSVTGSITVGNAIWVSGGSSSSAISTLFGSGVLGSIATSSSKSVTATFVLPSTVLGGTLVAGSSLIGGTSVPSSNLILTSVFSDPLTVAPGPANLAFSSLTCIDTNGDLLLAGDDVTCTLSIRPALGYEDVEGATATIQIPDGAQWSGGGDSHDATAIQLGAGSLGDVAAGDVKAAEFHLKVGNDTAPGTQLRPDATVSATSVPRGGATQRFLTGPTLLVGQVIVPAGEAPPSPTTVVDTPRTPVVPPTVAASKSYKLRAKTIRITLRRGHRRKSHLWKGSKRRTVFVKRFVVRTPNITGRVVRKVTVPKKGKNAPKRGKVRIKGTRLIYTVKMGKRRTDRFRYTITDTAGKKATGKVVVRWEKKARKKK